MMHLFAEALLGSLLLSFSSLFPAYCSFSRTQNTLARPVTIRIVNSSLRKGFLVLQRGLEKPRSPFPSGLRGPRQRSSGTNAYLTLAFACSVPLSCQTHLVSGAPRLLPAQPKFPI